MLFELKNIDRQFYQDRIKDFLPDEIIDIHTHVWRTNDFLSTVGMKENHKTVSWPWLVAKDNPVEDLIETYRIFFPEKKVTPLMFATLPEGNLDVQNQYVSKCAREKYFPALIFSDPAWSGEELERRIGEGGFLGAKSYLSLASPNIPTKDIRIYDFFPHNHLEIHNKHGWVVLLHIPGDGRLKDPVNLRQILEIEEKYPDIKLIVAHIGRAYCDSDVGNAFEILKNSKRFCFDFAANANDRVFERAIKCVGPKRILFGSDLPITRMRMRRVTVENRYVNLVPKGLYGDVSGDKNMGDVDGEDAEKLTFFMYEEIDAFRKASERAGLTKADIQDIFCNNAKRLLNI